MQLDPRKQRILQAIVRDYVDTAEPVGSGALSERHDFGVKPATIRNEMAEMADLGYLDQPHTSAGRIPSEKGYRFYVDWLITPQAPSPDECRRLRDQIDKARTEVERVLHQTCRMLSALTHYVSMATPPEMEQDQVRQLHLAVLDRHRLLAVLAMATGRVEHAVVSVAVDLMSIDLGRVERALAPWLQGHTAAQAVDAAAAPGEPLTTDSETVYYAVATAVKQTLSRIQAEQPGDVFVEGTSEVLRQPEFSYGEAVLPLMELLEERRRLFSLLRDAYARQAQVLIGSEGGDPRMRMCSLVAARYTVLGRYTGTIGVLGPTRMDYDRAVPAVRFMAESLGEVLTKLSL